MFIYYDSQGVLKEIINDEAIRQGNSGVNKIYFFIEGAEPQVNNEGTYIALTFDSALRTFIDTEGNQQTTEDTGVTTTTLEIPYDKKRELKFFKYFTKYQFFSATIPDELLNNSGTMGCRLEMIKNGKILALGLVVFNVEITTDLQGQHAIIEPDTAISIAEWNYLKKNMLLKDSYEGAVVDILLDNTDTTINSASVHPVQNKVVKSYVDAAVSTIKKNSYQLVDTEEYSTLEDFLESEGEEGYIYLYPKDLSDLSEGYHQYIWEVDDEEIGSWIYMGDTTVDLSNSVTLDGTQTITGNKTFEGNSFFAYTGEVTFASSPKFGADILPYVDNNSNIGSASYTWKDLHLSGKLNIGNGYLYNSGNNSLIFYINGADRIEITSNTIKPTTSGNLHLGSFSLKIGDIYQSGKIYNSSFIVNNGTNDVFKVDSVNGEVKTYYTIQPVSDNGCSLGKSNVRFNEINVGKVQNNFAVLQLVSGSDVTVKVGANKSFCPSSDTGNADLGSATAAWKDFYIAGDIKDSNGTSRLNFSTSGYATINCNLYPNTTNAFQLGYAQRVFSNVFTQGLSDGTNSVSVAEIGKVKTVNGTSPDSSGNVQVSVSQSGLFMHEINWGYTGRLKLVTRSSTQLTTVTDIYFAYLTAISATAHDTTHLLARWPVLDGTATSGGGVIFTSLTLTILTGASTSTTITISSSDTITDTVTTL